MKVKKALSLLSIKHNRPNLEIDNFNSEVDFDLNTHLESCLRLLYELDHSDLTLEEKDLLGKALLSFGQAMLTPPDLDMDI